MKKSLLALFLICGVLLFTSPSWAYTVGGGAEDVGGWDTYLTGFPGWGSETEEQNMVNTFLDPDVQYQFKYEGNDYWVPIDQAISGGIGYALDFRLFPDYENNVDFFIIKTGGNDNLKVTHCDHPKMTHPCFS